MAKAQGSAAVALRLAGASHIEIADGLGIASPEAVRRLIEETLGEFAPDVADRKRLRTEATLRLERLLKGVWTKAIDPNNGEHLSAVKVATALIDRLIRLNGLDAPAEVIVHNPTAAEIDRWVAELTAQSTAELRALEDNVIDADSEELDPDELEAAAP